MSYKTFTIASPLVYVSPLFALLFGCGSSPEDRVGELTRARDFQGLLEMVQGPDERIACKALNAIVWARGVDARAAHETALTVDRCGWEPRAEAGFRLAEELQGEDRLGAVAAMAAQLKDPNENMRWNMARTLAHLGHSAALPALVECSTDSNPFVAAWCVWSRCSLEGGADCKRPNMNLINGKPAP